LAEPLRLSLAEDLLVYLLALAVVSAQPASVAAVGLGNVPGQDLGDAVAREVAGRNRVRAHEGRLPVLGVVRDRRSARKGEEMKVGICIA
jgi:hypothetical protein